MELATSARAVAYLLAAVSAMRAPRAPPLPRDLEVSLEEDKVWSLRGLKVAVEEEKERENGLGVLAVEDVDNAVAAVDCKATGFCRAAIVAGCSEKRRLQREVERERG